MMQAQLRSKQAGFFFTLPSVILLLRLRVLTVRYNIKSLSQPAWPLGVTFAEPNWCHLCSHIISKPCLRIRQGHCLKLPSLTCNAQEELVSFRHVLASGNTAQFRSGCYLSCVLCPGWRVQDTGHMQFTRLKPELFHMDTNLNSLEAHWKITLLLTDLNINHVGHGLNQYFSVLLSTPWDSFCTFLHP